MEDSGSVEDGVYDKIDVANIGSDYDQIKKNIISRCFEQPTVWNTIGCLKGLSVLDLACGTGSRYSRGAKLRGALTVTGIDSSRKMVAIAKQEENGNPLGIEYLVADAANFKHDVEVDLVTGHFLLNYASTEEVLRDMCASVYASLRRGGRFVGLLPNLPGAANSFLKSSHPLGYELVWDGLVFDGSAITATLMSEDGIRISFTCYMWERGTVERVLRLSGFSSVEWVNLQFSGEDTELTRAARVDAVRCPIQVVVASKA